MSSSQRSGATRVAAGILSSRLIGFLRDRAVAHYFGIGPHADVFSTALRGPNILQNLLGEGTISASFIPIYSRLLEEGREEEAGRFAGAILGLLIALAATVALAGVLFARPIVAVLAAGFLSDRAAIAAGTATVDRYQLTVAAVRLIFPMTGVLVISAWALGVLNSHRRFFLPYVAPVAWNAAIIAALVWTGSRLADPQAAAGLDHLLIAACVGALVGGVLQLLVQLPLVVRLLRGFRLSMSLKVPGVRSAIAAFGPVVAGRGVVQVSAYLDLLLASLLATGAVSALRWAQTLYVLPVSLFGMSVAAAELPELARGGRGAVGPRVARGVGQTAFVSIPTAIGYLAFGTLVVGALYGTGRFTTDDTWVVALVLAGYSLGLPAGISSRLLQSAFFAASDTRTPALVATARVAVATGLGIPLMLLLDRVGVSGLVGGSGGLRLGAAGLSLAAGLGAWLEFALLWRRLGRHVPDRRLPLASIARMFGLALAAAALASLVWLALPPLHTILTAAIVLGIFAGTYLFAAWRLGVEEASPWFEALARSLRRR